MAPLTKSQTNSADAYDHAINLVDTTKPKVDDAQASSDDAPESSGASLSRRWTKGTLRRELAKRKYAKWQQDKSHAEDIEPSEVNPNQDAQDVSVTFSRADDKVSPSKNRLAAKRAARSKEGSTPKPASSPDSVIDILYENQRGWFLFGIPLYSANSLLNLDPAAWQTSDFKDSAVNITNAQVPDPSWEWAWRTWYVDMSHDVDEEGWEYSFSFQSRFAWHGSHPWFHSFARRRRWLRKRAKRHSSNITGGKGTLKDSHHLNADYFTIHGAKRDRSPESSQEATLAHRSSYTGYDGHESDSDEDVNDIPNVVALLAVLKKASVDREDIAAVRTFLAQGGEELHYLADKMDEIMGLLIYQNSRQQLFNYILEALETAKSTEAGEDQEQGFDQEAIDRKMSNLTKALEASRAYLDGMQYWQDSPQDEKVDGSGPTVAPAFGKGDTDWPEETKAHIEEENGNNEIKGIPANADVDVAPSPLRTFQSQVQPSANSNLDKGKGKAED
ncbi:MAG: hypothetical protein LQ352_001688 [Teloschistes flavicans]|nr:MAG: hypothetical protein LQ352_001688 [Teloschistes flavicans]